MEYKYSYVCILSDDKNKKLYLGVTSNLIRRVQQLKGKVRIRKIKLINLYNPTWSVYMEGLLIRSLCILRLKIGKKSTKGG